MGRIISPSLLSADFGNLNADLDMLNESAAEWVHLDIMDGRFVPNLMLSTAFVRQIRSATALPLDIHLMVERPEEKLDWLLKDRNRDDI